MTILNAEQKLMFDSMFKTLDHDELREVQKMVSEETRVRRELKTRNNKRSLKIGSIVEWTGQKSGSCTGEVIRVKRKKCIVKQTCPAVRMNGNWDIPMSMLTVVG
jgi:hypothetical protein